ncbi:deoxyhypusine synthase [Ferroglobus placidus DSM 10642]|uniref:Deoxyhypusine synthase n=1 Tax=Ferroglobus placidus (strain DSM 10642 / AEDII12DO) TaxID=589924 RepID=D3RY86_FERPA|nr:deoxyhypusine synthase [Ferroglobus placidus]ADC65449.1 deoxyhypusine synthase [Ferroglobus placidus DSM 10642]
MIREIDVKEGQKISELLEQFKDSAFNARRLGEAAEIFKEMVEKNSFIFLTLAGAIVPAGMRKIISGMLERGFAHALVTTGANVTHEIAEALGFKHQKGSERVDDVELSRKNVNRIYDVFVSNEAFEKVEEFTSRIFENLSGTYGSYELMWEIGKNLPENSFLRIAYEKKTPVFVPTIHDSILGLHLYIYGKDLIVDLKKDIGKILDLCFEKKPIGVCIIGGGVPKNFTLQAMLLGEGFDYAIQITTDSPQFGGLSGATLEEAKSWCKLKENAKAVTVYCDATIALPLIYSYLLDSKLLK